MIDEIERLRQRVSALEAQLARARPVDPRDAFLLRAFEDAPIGMALVGVDERIFEANAALCQMLGYTRDELLSRTVAAITHPEDQLVEARPKGELKEGRSSAFVVEKRYLRKDGSVMTGRLSVSAILGADGQVAWFVGQLEDVTEQRAIDARLAQSERLDSVARLAGGLAHDFNNLLGVILGTVQLVQDDLPADAPARADLALIESTAHRARDLTRRLLAVGRRGPRARGHADAGAVVRDTTPLLGSLVGEARALHLSLPTEPMWVPLDEVSLQQVLINLVSNARDALDVGGNVWVTVRAGRDDRVELIIEDDGHGMTPDVLAHAFDAFFTTKSPERGTGLGLFTVYGLVTRAGGAIDVASTPGNGTRVQIGLPRDAAIASGGVAAGSTPIGALRVLLVEDEPSLLEVSLRLLQRLGHTVSAFRDPQAALASVERGLAFDVLVTDVVMPGLVGPALHAAIEHLRGKTPVVFVSGYAEHDPPADRAHVTQLGKPFKSEALQERLVEVWHNR